MITKIRQYTTRLVLTATVVCSFALAPTSQAQLPADSRALIQEVFSGIDEGGDWWDAEIFSQQGYINTSLYPYIYVLGQDSWIYVLGDTNNAYIYSFEYSTWTYTNKDALPWVYLFEGPNSNLLQVLIGTRSGWVDPAIIQGFL